MHYAVFIALVTIIYLGTRLLLAMLTRELRARLGDHYRFIGPLVPPLHWILLLASVLIGMSLNDMDIGRFVLVFYLAIAWFVFRVFTTLVFEVWFGTLRASSCRAP
jgi:hypothetical protein